MLDKAISLTAAAIRDYLDYLGIGKFMSEKQPFYEQQIQNQGDVLTPEELMERANKDSAKEAGIRTAKEHINLFMEIRSQFTGKDESLLSSNISKVSSIPAQKKQQIANLQTKFAKIINSVANHIEEKKYESVEKAILDMQKKSQINAGQKNLMQQLVKSDKLFHISCQSLRVAVDFFIALNEYIVSEIEKCTDSEQESRLVLGNAILVYELTDFVIKYLQSFKTEGVSDIYSVKKEIDQDIEKIKLDLQGLKNKAQQEGILPELRENILSNVLNREEAVKIMNNDWNEYLGEIKSFSDEMTNLTRQWLPNLELMRDDAKNQIAVLEIINIVRILKTNLTALKTTVTKLETMKLVSLSPDRVRRLLGTIK